MSAPERIVLQNSFWITEGKFSGLWARHAGTTATSDELTANFGGALDRIELSVLVRCALIRSLMGQLIT
jgi:hypothetical protein